MPIDIKIPSVGESVQEAILSEWYKQDGESVQTDDLLFVIETDKVTLEVNAEAGGILKILVPAGETVVIGAVVGTIELFDAISEEEIELEKNAARFEIRNIGCKRRRHRTKDRCK